MSIENDTKKEKELTDSGAMLLLSFEEIYYRGYAWRKGRVTKSFRDYLKRK